MMAWCDILVELIRRTTSDLPEDVACALCTAVATEREASHAKLFLQVLLENSTLACKGSTPLCQDTGTLTFFWRVPCGTDTQALEHATREAVMCATRQGLLRRNTIETLSGASIDSNVADGTPVCLFEQVGIQTIEVWLIQKGGGCENVSTQYALPDAELCAGRDLEGVRKCLLHAVWHAQGFGCAPGVLGVCIGADRAEGYVTAKRQLLRRLTDSATDLKLAALEQRVLSEANLLGIGPMGMGGNTTLLGVKIATRPRLPASYIVTVEYMCWACRRRGVRVTGETVEWMG